jgi:FdhD protein
LKWFLSPTHFPEQTGANQLMPSAIQKKKLIANATGVILAGGRSSRMGSNKALLPYRGGLFIESIHRLLRTMFPEVILVTNNPEQFDMLPCRKVPDLFEQMGVLAGIHSGLYHCSNHSIFAVACDMPYLKESLIRSMASRFEDGSVLIPETPGGLEPLHAFYSKECLGAIEATLLSGQRRIVSFFDRITVSRMTMEQVAIHDPLFASFVNINTPGDYYKLRDEERRARPTVETGQAERASPQQQFQENFRHQASIS